MARHRHTQHGSGFRLMEGPNAVRFFGLLVLSGLAAGSLWLAGSLHAQDDPAAEENPFAKFPNRSAEAAVEAAPAPAPAAAPATSKDDVRRRRVADRMRQARKSLEE